MRLVLSYLAIRLKCGDIERKGCNPFISKDYSKCPLRVVQAIRRVADAGNGICYAVCVRGSYRLSFDLVWIRENPELLALTFSISFVVQRRES